MAGKTVVLVTRPCLGTVSEEDRDFGVEDFARAPAYSQ